MPAILKQKLACLLDNDLHTPIIGQFLHDALGELQGVKDCKTYAPFGWFEQQRIEEGPYPSTSAKWALEFVAANCRRVGPKIEMLPPLVSDDRKPTEKETKTQLVREGIRPNPGPGPSSVMFAYVTPDSEGEMVECMRTMVPPGGYLIINTTVIDNHLMSMSEYIIA